MATKKETKKEELLEFAALGDQAVRRGRLAIWLMGVIALAVGFATAVRPVLSDMNIVFSVFGFLATSMIAGMWLLFRHYDWYRQAPFVLIAVSHGLALPFMMISGGPNSHLASVIPIFPVIGVLLLSKRMAGGIVLFWLITLPIMYLLLTVFPDLSDETVSRDKTVSRTFWLMLSSVITLLFCSQFESRASELEQLLKRQAELDPLTGIGNRRLLERRLGSEISRSVRHNRWLTVMLVDVDHFKQFNDSRGHAEGDGALQQVADVLVAQTRQGQDTVARYGGEEFVVVLGETPPEQAQVVGEKIRRAVEALDLPYMLAGGDTSGSGRVRSLTVTIGMASGKGAELYSAELLMQLADAALYEGKQNGRNRVVAQALA